MQRRLNEDRAPYGHVNQIRLSGPERGKFLRGRSSNVVGWTGVRWKAHLRLSSLDRISQADQTTIQDGKKAKGIINFEPRWRDERKHPIATADAVADV